MANDEGQTSLNSTTKVCVVDSSTIFIFIFRAYILISWVQSIEMKSIVMIITTITMKMAVTLTLTAMSRTMRMAMQLTTVANYNLLKTSSCRRKKN